MMLIKVQFLLGNRVQLSVCLEKKKPKKNKTKHHGIKLLRLTCECAAVVAMEKAYYAQFMVAISSRVNSVIKGNVTGF